MKKKLHNFFTTKGFEIKFKGVTTLQHYGGRSFANDGTYQEESYKITKGKSYYFIHYKCTGRPEFILKDRDYHILTDPE